MGRERRITVPTDDEINASYAALDSMNPYAVAADLENMAGVIRRGDADLVNGARLVALLRISAEFIRPDASECPTHPLPAVEPPASDDDKPRR
jgi:hypothetical protein